MFPAGRCRPLSKASLLQADKLGLMSWSPASDISKLVSRAMPTRAFMEIYWPTLHSSSLLQTRNVHICWSDKQDCLLGGQSRVF